jgi:hypothetical protein
VRNLEPLSRDELERLWRWERHMTRFHAVAMTLLLVCAAATFLWSDIAWLRRLLLAIVLLLVAAATMLQLREKCPRCGARLRTKSLLRLPERCSICKIAFERPPAS